MRARGGCASKREELRRERRELTPTEARLWRSLRRRGCGARFRNHHIVAGFIVDFYAPELRLAVEVDGPVHERQREYDEARTVALEALGVRVYRVSNERVFAELTTVLREIERLVAELRGASPLPK